MKVLTARLLPLTVRSTFESDDVLVFGGLGFARSVLFLGWPLAAVLATVLAAVTFKVASDAYAQTDHVPSKEGAPA